MTSDARTYVCILEIIFILYQSRGLFGCNLRKKIIVALCFFNLILIDAGSFSRLAAPASSRREPKKEQQLFHIREFGQITTLHRGESGKLKNYIIDKIKRTHKRTSDARFYIYIEDELCSLLQVGDEHSRIYKAKIKGRVMLALTFVYQR